jgi:hypothetical protein
MIIDISYAQGAVPAGPWTGCIVQLTHDTHGFDVMGDRHFHDAARFPMRGGYHYANPAASEASTQAALFVNRASALGFRRDVDCWALDFEERALPSADANRSWITTWMAYVRGALGSRGFLYVGWPYAQASGLDAGFLRKFNWWLPAYGPNDGQPHDPVCPFAPVLHQYTSRGGPGGTGLDVSRIMDQAGYDRMFGASPAPVPAPAPRPPVQAPTIDHGDDVKTTDINGIELDSHGNGYVDLRGVSFGNVGPVAIIGGSDPAHTGLYQRTPVARLVKVGNVARVVLATGEPKGVYTVRVTHA